MKRPPSNLDKEIRCYKCNEIGHKANVCPKRAKINAVFETPAEGILVPVLLNNTKIYAILDTGASRTCVDLNYAKNIGCSLTTYEGSVQLATQTSHFDAFTTVVEVTCGKYSVSQEVLCFEMVGEAKMLLGRDLMATFNLEIRGIPLQFSVPNDVSAEMDFSVFISTVDSVVDKEILAKIKKEIADELMENSQVNRADLCKLPYAEVALETGVAAPVCKRQYKIANHLLDQIQERIDSWFSTGTITNAPIDSEWNSPLVAAPKKDEEGKYTKLRLCLDTRGLNSVLKDVYYNLPLIKDIFDKISGFKIASRLDLADSFNQLPIKINDRPKTTFTFMNKRFMFNGAPFGIKILTAHLQKVLTRLMEPFMGFVAIFVDDIVVFSDSVENHVTHLKLVIQALNQANLKLRAEKCLFGCTELVILGHVISGDTIRADPVKLSAFQDIPTPTTGKQLESFLGTTSYLRDYIPLYSRIAAPLEKFRKVKGSLSKYWDDECDNSFAAFKKILSTPPVLSMPDFSHEFTVGTDASNYGVGAVLYQEINGIKKYVSFASSALSPAQRNYPATKKELLAIVFALKKFREWLWGKHFTLYTDHMSLIYLFKNSEENNMLSNWADQILDYNFTVVHCPGITNVLPDYLSRIYCPQKDSNSRSRAEVLMTTTIPKKADYELRKFIRERFDKLEPEDDLKLDLLTKAHVVNHQGAEQLFKQVFTNGYYWSSLRKDCEELVNTCPQCLAFNVHKAGYHPLTTITASLPFDHVAIDLFGPLQETKNGCCYALILTDIATRFVCLAPLVDKSAMTIAQALYPIFCNFGFPKIMQSDNGTEFVNQVVAQFTKLVGISHRLIAPYHPEANGAAERHVALSKTLLSKLSGGDFTEWDKYLPSVQLGLNARISSRHKSTPFGLMFGRKLNSLINYSGTKSDPITEDELLRKSKLMVDIIYPITSSASEYNEKMVKSFSSGKRVMNELSPGTKVMIRNLDRTKKTSELFVGPYEIVKCEGGAYTVKDAAGTIHNSLITPKFIKVIKNKSIDDDDDDASYEVQRILAHRGAGEKREYLVRWKGYTSDHDSWEPLSNFNTREVIERYHAAKSLRAGQQRAKKSRGRSHLRTDKKAVNK